MTGFRFGLLPHRAEQSNLPLPFSELLSGQDPAGGFSGIIDIRKVGCWALLRPGCGGLSFAASLGCVCVMLAGRMTLTPIIDGYAYWRSTAKRMAPAMDLLSVTRGH